MPATYEGYRGAHTKRIPQIKRLHEKGKNLTEIADALGFHGPTPRMVKYILQREGVLANRKARKRR